MRFSSADEFRALPRKAVTVLGMSGVGKTTVAMRLRRDSWFHYSVDYRIGTRYMGEHIVDNAKREAMKVPFLRNLLMTDSIYISSNISFDNLSPLSTYLGKPGDPDKGGIDFQEYRNRLAQHRDAEICAMRDVADFIEKSREIYGYDHFICDSSGSICEIVDPEDDNDPVLSVLGEKTVLLYIEGPPDHAAELTRRFRADPKPIYYQDEYLTRSWAAYKAETGVASDNAVDPDAFAVWGFERLIAHRLPIYKAIADRHGYTVTAAEIEAVKSADDFVDLIGRAIERSPA